MERVTSDDRVRIREVPLEKRLHPPEPEVLTRTQWVTPCGVMEIVFRESLVIAADFIDKTSYIPDHGSIEPPFSFPVDVLLCGTEFQLRVWRILRTIPLGETVTYQWIAQQIGQPTAARAVGQAVGANPVAWFVPCHRVVPKVGGVGGFRWGWEIKEKLLAAERSKLDLLFHFDIDSQNQVS